MTTDTLSPMVETQTPRPFALSSTAGVLRSEDAPLLVGILNITPDSFYDGGRHFSPDAAIRRGVDLAGEGARWIDVGGMSSRPGAGEISADEEIRRIEPVIAELVLRCRGTWISVDTYRAEVARRALAAGATAVNDISALGDPAMTQILVDAKCPVVLMHMQGTPATMQDAPAYDDVWGEIIRFFEERMDRFVRAGGNENRIVLDPGVGFGKNLEHNVEILRGLSKIHSMGRPVMLGCSRKSFIHHLTGAAVSPDRRLPGSLAAAAAAILHGVQFLRVHDVADTAQFLKVFRTVTRHGG